MFCRSIFFVTFLALTLSTVVANQNITRAIGLRGSIQTQHMQTTKYVVSLADVGGSGDGTTLNTASILEAVARIRSNGGGTLRVPSGTWLTGPFNMTSNMTLHLEEGAILMAATDKHLWPTVAALPTYGGSRNTGLPFRTAPFIGGFDVSNVKITGNMGVVDGQGKSWWTTCSIRTRETSNCTPPHLIEFVRSSDLEIAHVQLRNSPFWTVHPYYSDDIYIHDISITNPHDAPNADGVDPDSCNNVRIENMVYSGSDDAVSIKSGWDCFGYGSLGKPSTNIFIRNLVADSESSGVAIGSEMSGGVENVTVMDCDFRGSTRAALVYLKSNDYRGGYMRNILFSNLTFHDGTKAFGIISNYPGWNDACPYHDKRTTSIANIRFEDIRQAAGSQLSNRERWAEFNGTAESPIVNLSLENVQLDAVYASATMTCTAVLGTAKDVTPAACADLTNASVLDHQGGHLIR